MVGDHQRRHDWINVLSYYLQSHGSKSCLIIYNLMKLNYNFSVILSCVEGTAYV